MEKFPIWLPPSIPDHELIRRIGKGSYGEVWLARTQMDTYRAVKIVYGDRFGEDERSFERELDGLKRFEPISRSHEGLVAILHFGRQTGHNCFYYVMELADDFVGGSRIDPNTYVPRTLTTQVKQQGRLPVETCVRLGTSLSQALGEIHRHGLVHRDIKPSNIIFVNGIPKLADVGLVADVAEAHSYVGTEGFIPPEGPGSQQADIYSLGKLLYEISTGKDRTEFPALPPDMVEARESGFLELNELLLKACQTDKNKRYRTAKDLQADLALIQTGKSLRRLRKLERWFTHLKRLGLAACLLIPALLLLYLQFDFRRKKAAEIRQLHLGGYLADGSYALNQGDYAASVSPFLAALSLETDQAESSRTHRLRLKAILERCPKLAQVFFHDRPLVEHAEFSQSGDQVLTCNSLGRAQIWSTLDGNLSQAFAGTNWLEYASFSPNAKYVVTASHFGGADVWNAAGGDHVLSLPNYDSRLHSARFSPDMQHIITAGSNGTARVWAFPSARLMAILSQHTNELTYAAYSHDGTRIVTTGKDLIAIIWDATTFKPLKVLRHRNWIYHADFSPDGRLLVTASFDRSARLWNADTGEQLYPEMEHGDGVFSARFSPDGRYIVTACLDGSVRLWNVMSRQPVTPNPVLRHGDRVMDASFSPGGRQVLSACADGTARIWDLAGSMEPLASATNYYSINGKLLNITRVKASISGVSLRTLSSTTPRDVFPKHTVSRNGNYLLELQAPGTFQAWDLETLKPLSGAVSISAMNEPTSGAISEDGRHAIVYSRTGGQVYDLRSGKQIFSRLESGPTTITGAAFSPDSQYVTLYGGSSAQVWELKSGRPIFPSSKHKGRLRYADFSPDSRQLVVCATSDALERQSAQIWYLSTPKGLPKVLPHGDGVLMAAFSPDNLRLVTASEDFYAAVWESSSGTQLSPALQHGNKVVCAAFSSDGQLIVTADADHYLRLWDTATRRPVTPPIPLPGTPLRACFVEKNTAVFVITEEGEGWLCPLAAETKTIDELSWFCELVCGQSDLEASRFRMSSQERLKDGWIKFTRQYPEDFRATKEEILAWHHREIAQAEADQQIQARDFHAQIMDNLERSNR